MHILHSMEELKMLNKKVIESIAVCGLCGVMAITAVTNSGSTANVSVDKVLANTSLGYDGYAGVTAVLHGYESNLIRTASLSVEKDEGVIVTSSSGSDQEPSVNDTANDAAQENAIQETAAADSVENTAQEPVQQELTPEQQEWQNKLMPNVEESLNVRADANEDSEIVGKLYKGDAAEITGTNGEWTQITSGNVNGYVKTAYCVTGNDALAYAQQTCGYMASVNTDGLRIREEQSEDSKVIKAVEAGTKLPVDSSAETTDGWVAVVCDSSTRFVSSDFVTLSLNTGVGMTIEEEQAKIAAEKAEAEAKAKAEEEAKKEAEKSSAKASSDESSGASDESSSSSSQNEAVDADADDLTLLAAIIECEAGGESYDCQLAVGAVIINRLNSGSYPDSLHGVIYQRGQFGPASSGKLARKLAGHISSTSYAAAQEALNGSDNTGGALSFNDVGSGKTGLVIGNMVFD